MSYLSNNDWKSYLEKIKDENSFINKFKSMAKIHNNLLFLFKKLIQNNNLSFNDKISLNSLF